MPEINGIIEQGETVTLQTGGNVASREWHTILGFIGTSPKEQFEFGETAEVVSINENNQTATVQQNINNEAITFIVPLGNLLELPTGEDGGAVLPEIRNGAGPVNFEPHGHDGTYALYSTPGDETSRQPSSFFDNGAYPLAQGNEENPNGMMINGVLWVRLNVNGQDLWARGDRLDTETIPVAY